MRSPKMVNTVFAIVALTACGDDSPQLSNARCAPQMLSATPPGPYTVNCDVDFEGEVGDVNATAYDAAFQVWASDFENVQGIIGNSFRVTFTNTQAPPVGTMTFRITAEHPAGEDGPAGDEITATIQVVP